MSIFECILVYIFSWWLVLFMVLPWGVRTAEKPEPGHATSAPMNPNLRKKFIITSILALLGPAIGLGISAARAAESGIYHASSNDCAEAADATPDASVNATDTNATLGGPAAMGEVPTFIDAPASDYTNNAAIRDRAGFSSLQLGVVTTNTQTGEVRMNGQALNGASRPNTDCNK